jgi:hypothetical protein
MTRTNKGPSDVHGVDALRALRSLQPPAGMQERLVENILHRARERGVDPAGRGFHWEAWKLWASAGLAVVAAASILCIVALQGHRETGQPLEARVPARGINPAIARADARQTGRPVHAVARSYREPRRVTSAPVPHTAPPMPLSAQERLLVALAGRPALAASAAVSRPVSDSGLGANALFELDHEQLTPLQAVPLESTPIPPLPSNPISSGESQ